VGVVAGGVRLERRAAAAVTWLIVGLAVIVALVALAIAFGPGDDEL
jgi:hypothetical protein